MSKVTVPDNGLVVGFDVPRDGGPVAVGRNVVEPATRRTVPWSVLRPPARTRNALRGRDEVALGGAAGDHAKGPSRRVDPETGSAGDVALHGDPLSRTATRTAERVGGGALPEGQQEELVSAHALPAQVGCFCGAKGGGGSGH